ncbi:MgtC/SapB family protein [Candidatus Woesearchaeota archaeon]|nr:MgtC/SapB family protein [Candidatus Woesearchaeota archaeon]
MVAETELLGRALLAVGVGALIGLEREIRRSPAGLRTHTLVCLGSALFTIASITIGGNADISRIAGQVAVGIGFLGGGVIFKLKDRVVGLTTAADLWVVAALGLLIGIGQYLLVFVSLALVLFLLIGGAFLEKKGLHT